MAIDGANRDDSMMLTSPLDDAGAKGLLRDIGTIWLDRGYDSDATLDRLKEHQSTDAIIAKWRKRGDAESKNRQPMGLRWSVEPTNSSLSNFGQLRRTSDRKSAHPLAQFPVTVVFLLGANLNDWLNRWIPGCVPIR